MSVHIKEFFGCVACAAMIAGPWLIDTILEVLK